VCPIRYYAHFIHQISQDWGRQVSSPDPRAGVPRLATRTSPRAPTSRRSRPTPSAAGRPWIAHITDETTVEELSYTYSFANEAPHHVAAVRTPSAKYAVYSPWKEGTIEVDTSDQDFELYDYSSNDGQLELANLAGTGSKLQAEMSALLQSEVILNEIRAPLPRHLRAAQKEGMEDFFARTEELAP